MERKTTRRKPAAKEAVVAPEEAEKKEEAPITESANAPASVAEERQQSEFEYGLPRPTAALPPVTEQQNAAAIRSVTEHTCVVRLPDGTDCQVTYTWHGPEAHRFAFAAPLHQRIWHCFPVNGVPSVEESARVMAAMAFRLSQCDEQREMRRRSPSPKLPKPVLSGEAQLRRKDADRYAGLYAVCVRFASGTLQPIGTLHEFPDDACRDLREGRYENVTLFPVQSRVIGICWRLGRCWKQPQFLASCPPKDGEEAA